MTNRTLDAIEQVLVRADEFICGQLEGTECHHLTVAITPHGASVVGSNTDPEALRQVASVLMKIADDAAAAGDDAGSRP